jgi:hypothetical protein
LQEMILLMSETSRLDEEQSVLIRSQPQYVPWLIAFIRWSLGEPPFVQLATGRVLNDQKKPQILLIVLEKPRFEARVEQTRTPAEGSNAADLHISAAYCTKSLKSLVMAEENPKSMIKWQGLMTASDWASYKLRRLFYPDPQLHQNPKLLEIARQAISFIVGVMPRHLYFGDYSGKFSRMTWKGWSFNTQLGCSPFPDAQERIALAQELLGIHIPLSSPYSVSDQMSQLKILVGTMDGMKNPDLVYDIVALGADLTLLSLFGNNSKNLPMITTNS